MTKEEKAQYYKEYYEKNKERIKSKVAQYRIDNKKVVNDKQRNFYLNHKEDFYNKHKTYVKNNPEKIMYWTTKGRAKKFGIPFDIEITDIVIPDKCPILGIPLISGRGGGAVTNNSPSLDKIIPNRGYVKGNVKVISMKANAMKSNATIEEMERILAYMKEVSNVNPD